MERFFVRSPSVNAVKRALGRAPGGVKVIGRFDRETIECSHTMDPHSLARHWRISLSRLSKDGLSVVEKPGMARKDEPGSPSDPSSEIESPSQ